MKILDWKRPAAWLAKNKLLLLVLALGIVLLLTPSREKPAQKQEGLPLKSTGVLLSEEADRLALVLSDMQGVGRAQALLSESGAVVLCDGADSAQVRLYGTLSTAPGWALVKYGRQFGWVSQDFLVLGR